MSASQPLRAAVVGVGHLGKEHARVWASTPGATLVAVCDRDPEAARKVARKLKVPAVSTPEDLPRDLDVASVATPTTTHRAVAQGLLQRGVHCLVEKPLASTLEEALLLRDLARKQGVLLSVGHIERFNPALKAALSAGPDPKFISVHRVSPFSFRSADIGVVLDLMIHDLDVVLQLVHSFPDRVDAVGAALVGEHEDLANVRITFASGCVANLTASRVAMKSERKFRIFSRHLYCSIDFAGRQATVVRLSPRVTPESIGIDPRRPDSLRSLAGKVAFGDLLDVQRIKMKSEREPLAEELAAFARAVRGEGELVVTADDGVAAIRLASRVLRAIGAHRWS